jgi:endogenous inhibitor of DNA gyrase (YacG/DUF329 family)
MQRLNCPTCKKPVEWSDAFPYRPFCCKRCQLIDFGGWATEKYTLPVEASEDIDTTEPLSSGELETFQ